MNRMSYLRSSLLIAFLAIGLMLGSCADMKDFPATPTETSSADSLETVIRLSIRLSPTSATSRAGETTDLNGTPAENIVKTLVLGITDENWNLMAYTPLLEAISTSTDPNYDYQFSQKFTLSRGIIHVIVIANLGAAQFSQLFQQAQGQGNQSDIIHYLPVTNEGTTYADVIGYFAPGSGGKATQTDISKGIVMTGFGMYNHSEDILLDRSYTNRNPLALTVTLTRTIAKIHLLTQADSGSDGAGGNITTTYLPTYAADATPATNRSDHAMGFIKASDVIYTINSLNKRTYLMPRKASNQAYLYEDPNMTMTGANGFINLETQPATYINIPENFIFKTSRDFSILSPTSKRNRFETAEPYDRERFDASPWSNRRYTRGMYATENLYDKPSLGSALSDGQQDGTTRGNSILANNRNEAVRAITTLSVGARLMPRQVIFNTQVLSDLILIATTPTNTQLPEEDKTRFLRILRRYSSYTVINDNDSQYPEWMKPHKSHSDIDNPTVFNFGNPEETVTDDEIYDDIEYLLTLDLRYKNKFQAWGTEDLSTGTTHFPSGTYWVYQDSGQYYFLSASMAESDLITGDSGRLLATSPRIGGWCFYFSYIRDTNAADDYTPPTEEDQTYIDGQVTRNKYYLLRLQRVLTPGSGLFSGEYIQLSTRRSEWINGGTADVTLN